MSRSRVALALLLVVVAIVIQTTVFAAGRVQPLGVAPALVALVIILLVPYVEPEYHLLLGFTAGILMDLVGSGTLGLWAMSLTAVAYAASRLRDRFTRGPFVVGAAVVALTILGQVVYIVLGTLFGQNTIAEPQIVSKILLPGLWNLVLMYPVLIGLKLAFKPMERGWAA
ncbi:MAG: rod shape-determining protein MreD [Actinomycetia bacterium]|nr:rod shape-determining protein MreD [Actinomycetes bacterium]